MVNTIDKELGGKVRTIRLARKISQNDVAQALDINELDVEKLENGQKRLAAAQLVELGEIFGIGAEEFLFHVEGTGRAVMGASVNVFERLDGDALEFAYLFSKISNPRHRDAVMRLTRSLVDDPSLNQ